jgi:outer membrane protein
MKRFLTIAISAIFALFLFAGSASAEMKLGSIDLRKVFDGYWKTKQADASLKDRAADMEKEHKNMLDDYKKGREDYQAILNNINDPAITGDEKDKRKKTAEDKLRYLKDQEETITQYERQARTTLDEQRRRMRDNILTEIRNLITAKAKDGNFTIVVDSAADSINSTPFILYINNPDNDFTQEILTKLNSTAPPDAAKFDRKDDKGSSLLDDKKAPTPKPEEKKK